MIEAEIRDVDNNIVDRVQLPQEIFGLEVRQDILQSAVVNYLANQRQGTHATKTRGLVRGGGRKPWKQKHTGRARHGSNRSPLWKGGGTIFGPQPRDYSFKLNKQFKRLALNTALSAKLSEGKLLVINALQVEKVSTKGIVGILGKLGIEQQRVLIVLPPARQPGADATVDGSVLDNNRRVVLSARNIYGVRVINVTDINTYGILAHDYVLMTKDSLSLFSATKGGTN
ncbi:MAG: 50S ribosomal protein L4 [Candidatus Magnetobacterium sp. LHC-1]|uniref:Large ribosomal subunit protein uL4 n=1 Tax=Candidatus Magnetobacterium casense TaxID=1455061 RepID=A0ABS6RWM1_9BACT|nr:50S ribosomal protein L4 [Candidatus Magnetobacterium casensis]MBF0607830.1 50S ribosomal protein L4 [Nitrospirota bacterium]MBV6340658.1 50S ribosomal protein L4 [Candidatus Magnetobacterium casensis]